MEEENSNRQTDLEDRELDLEKAANYCKEKEWVYWLTSEHRKKQEVPNRLFMANNYLDHGRFELSHQARLH